MLVTLKFSAPVSMVIFTILDLDGSRRGLIRVDLTRMREFRERISRLTSVKRAPTMPYHG